MNISQGLTHAKRIAGTHLAIVCGDTRYNWNEFDQRTDALARGLASLGVQGGDRVAVLMLNCHRYLELYYACARMGAIIVPLNIRLARPDASDDEVVRAAELAGAAAFINQLSQGYATEIGERGVRLSAGQAQRSPAARG